MQGPTYHGQCQPEAHMQGKSLRCCVTRA